MRTTIARLFAILLGFGLAVLSGVAAITVLCGAAQAYTLTLSCPDAGGTCTFTGPPITQTTPPPTPGSPPTACVMTGGGTFPSGTTVNLSVACQSSLPLTYQWYAGGAPVVIATSSSYQVTPSPGSYSYSVTVTNSAGSANVYATVTITTPPPPPSAGNCAPYGTVVDRGPLRPGATTIMTNGEVSRFSIVPTGGWLATSAKVSEFQALQSMRTTGFSTDPNCGAFLAGGWHSSTSGVDMIANGAALGNSNDWASVSVGGTYYFYVYYRDGLPGTRQTCSDNCNFILTVENY